MRNLERLPFMGLMDLITHQMWPLNSRLGSRALNSRIGGARFLLLLSLLSMGGFGAAAQTSPDPLSWIIEHKDLWPEEVTLLQSTRFPVVIDGKVIGSAEVPAGKKVQLIKIEPAFLTAKYRGATQRLPLAATDLRRRALEAMSTRKTPKKRMGFVHPGLLHTEADFARMRAKVNAKESPWFEGWEKLTSSRNARLNWNSRPTETVVRGGNGQNFPVLFNDIHAAYQLALRWKISGEEDYAKKSIEILNAWSSTLKHLNGNADRFLAAGIYGYQFANAAEIMGTYPGWSRADFKRFQEMMLEVFYPMNESFLFGRDGGKDHNGAAITNYWANWDLCNIASMQAIGVLCDRQDIYDRAMNYFKEGRGNGALEKAIYYVHDGNLGQWQESGRDQGHTTLGIALMGPIMETAWNQGEDLYGFDNNRFLAGAEYVAKYNLGNEVPFQTYAWGTGPRGDRREQTHISGGQGAFRAGYELVINHYVNRMGIAAPYSEQFAARVRPEAAPGGHASSFDQFGLGTLTATREPEVSNPKPSGLVVRKHGGQAVLSWWGAAGVNSYIVKRGTSPGGPYTTIARDVKDPLTYTDKPSEPGKYYYVITGIRDGKEIGPSNEVSFASEPVLRVHLRFDELGGNVTRDSVGTIEPATLGGEPQFSGGSILLDGNNDYVELPPAVVSELSDFTIAAWVDLDDTKAWSRIFDFGDDCGFWMFLTPKSGGGKPRFEVTTVYGYNAQRIESDSDFPTGRWVHVAVTLSGREGKLYIDGKEVGSNPGIDFPPFRLHNTPQNWIGRSQFEQDPYLHGKVGDFRIYDGALTPERIASLANSKAPFETSSSE